MPLTDKDLRALSRSYAWPAEKPALSSAEWALDGGGKGLVTRNFRTDEPFLVLEIGAFLGSSVRRWLSVSRNVYVAAIDPWEGEWWTGYAREHGRDALAKQFAQKDGPYLTFLSSLWESRERLFPVRGFSPEKLYELAELGVKPDLVFFDSNKTGEDIEVVHQLFPDAILTGDDWTWGVGNVYPIRVAVKAFAQKHRYNVVSDRATWMLVARDLSIPEKIGNLSSGARDIARAFKGLFA